MPSSQNTSVHGEDHLIRLLGHPELGDHCIPRERGRSGLLTPNEEEDTRVFRLAAHPTQSSSVLGNTRATDRAMSLGTTPSFRGMLVCLIFTHT